MAKMAPIVFKLEDVELESAPGVVLSSVEVDVQIMSRPGMQEWFPIEVAVGWRHLDRWKSYFSGDWLFEQVAEHLIKHHESEITEQCEEAARLEETHRGR